jgi:hypothetical protein
MTEQTRELLRQLAEARTELDGALERFDALGLAARRAGATWRDLAAPSATSPNTVHGWWSHADGRRRFSLAGLRATAPARPEIPKQPAARGADMSADDLRAFFRAERSRS